MVTRQLFHLEKKLSFLKHNNINFVREFISATREQQLSERIFLNKHNNINLVKEFISATREHQLSERIFLNEFTNITKNYKKSNRSYEVMPTNKACTVNQ